MKMLKAGMPTGLLVIEAKWSLSEDGLVSSISQVVGKMYACAKCFRWDSPSLLAGLL